MPSRVPSLYVSFRPQMYFARCDPKTKPQLTSTVAGSVVGPTVVVKCESLLLNRGEGFILARAFFELPQLTSEKI